MICKKLSKNENVDQELSLKENKNKKSNILSVVD